MFFVFNLLNFRYFNEKLTGEKRIKEPNTGGMAQEEKPAEKREKGRKKELLLKFMILSIQFTVSFISSMLKHRKSSFFFI